MRPSSRRLARALAERLAGIVPPPLHVRAGGDIVHVEADGRALGGSAAACIVEADDDRTDGERLECAIRAVLDGVQDCVAERLARPWPADAGDTPAGAMALPGARAEGGGARLWYGSGEDDAVVALRPIAPEEWMEA